MKKQLITLMIFAAAFTLLGCNKNVSNAKNGNNDLSLSNTSSAALSTANMNSETDNQKAPAFTLQDVNGKKISLSDYKGKVVIVDFWATWCPPCRRSIPDLIDLQKKYKNKIAVIGISVDMDTRSDVAPFVKKNKINYKVLYATPEVVQAYGNIDAIPTSFIIDQHGNIVTQHVGLTPKETYINEINKLLKKS